MSIEVQRIAPEVESSQWQAGLDIEGRSCQIEPATAHTDRSISLESQTAAWLTVLESSLLVKPNQIAYCHVWKRLVDVVVASIVLTMFAPLMIVVGLAIRLDSRGPVIFCQKRIGRGGAPFRVYKFRTMRQAPEVGLQFLRDEHGQLRHKIKDDPRVTRLGKVIRRTSIDELPQLINVLRGDMSLVGPRPELPQIVQGYEDWQHRRHLVRPGLTGWWQIQGRSDLPMHEHTELDLHYVENMSWQLDFQILRRTVRSVTGGFGAF
jgi:exopolysaccharide biosynthesis polyprenyl glycosylphosphotransferase